MADDANYKFVQQLGRGAFGVALLYQRCEGGDGVSPAGIGIGADRRADFERELAQRIANGDQPAQP